MRSRPSPNPGGPFWLCLAASPTTDPRGLPDSCNGPHLVATPANVSPPNTTAANAIANKQCNKFIVAVSGRRPRGATKPGTIAEHAEVQTRTPHMLSLKLFDPTRAKQPPEIIPAPPKHSTINRHSSAEQELGSWEMNRAIGALEGNGPKSGQGSPGLRCRRPSRLWRENEVPEQLLKSRAPHVPESFPRQPSVLLSLQSCTTVVDQHLPKSRLLRQLLDNNCATFRRRVCEGSFLGLLARNFSAAFWELNSPATAGLYKATGIATPKEPSAILHSSAQIGRTSESPARLWVGSRFQRVRADRWDWLEIRNIVPLHRTWCRSR